MLKGRIIMTIREIADFAGVSPATVSLVLNDKDGVSLETKKRIKNILVETGYVPKKVIMRSGRKNIRFIKYKEDGLLVEHNGDFISCVIDGVEDEARNSGLNLKITNVTSLNFEMMIDEINHELDDGIVILGTEFKACNSVLLKKFQAPIVVVDNEMRNQDFDSVVMNNEQAVYTAVSYLKELGHRRIGHIHSKCATDNLIAREMGFQRAMQELDLPINPYDTYNVIPDLEASYSMMLKYAEKRESFPTAFFADNDILAVGALRAFKQVGKSVPNDISIIGMDDLMLASISDPPLTTLKIHKKTMGRMAVSRLMDKIFQGDQTVLKILVDAELVVRKSTSVYQENIV
jgi:DNA-binding LacI/PurR family transcriptional regulator